MGFAAIAGLVLIVLPDATEIRLSEGAAVKWGSDVFVPRHATYGALGAVEALGEGVGTEVPAMGMTLLPPSTTAAADLVQPGIQTARVTTWIAQYDSDAMAVTGTPRMVFDGFLDQARLSRSAGSLELAITVVSLLEHLFELNIGNWLSPSFHKSVWPGETGEDQATGLVIQDAWGVESPPSQGGTGTGGGGRVSIFDMAARNV